MQNIITPQPEVNAYSGNTCQDTRTPQSEMLHPGRNSHSGELPLSFEQTRIWTEEMILKSANYNEVSAWKLSGELHVDDLKSALQKIVNRHEILRTTFPLGDQGPYQQVSQEMELSLIITDFSSLPAVEQEIAIDLALSKEAAHVFDLAQLPLFRVSLLQTRPSEHILILCAHHIIFDGWSNELFARELALFYENPLVVSETDAAPLPIQYADFALWQKRSICQEALDSQLRFWKTELQDLQTLNGLQTPASRSTAGRRTFFPINLQLANDLRKLCKQAGVTPFLFFMGAFQVLLARKFNIRDIPVGVPISNRDKPQTQQLIGFFVNTIIVRGRLSGEMTFMDFLARLLAYMSKAVDNKHVPFDKVVAALNPTRDANLNSLFQYMFDHRKISADVIQLGDLKVEPVRVKAGSSRFDIFMSVLDGKTTLSTSWEYKTDLFSPGDIEKLDEDFQEILKKVLEEPRISISQLIGSDQSNEIGKGNSEKQFASTPPAAQAGPINGLEDQGVDAIQSTNGLTPLQKQIQDIWKDTLGVTFADVDDDFFKIGGDSLMAIRVHNRLLNKIGVEELSITDVFNFPTIRALSEHLETMIVNAR